MHSHHKKTINVVEEMLDVLIKEEDEHDTDNEYLKGIYPVQSTALLYEEFGGSQDEK